jgi:hypothetical protein
VFGSRSRTEKLKRGATNGSALVAAYAGARPVAERLLYDDDLRDNIRTLIEASRKILDELSDESPQEIVAKLWDDDKVRNQVESAVGAAQEGAKRVRGQKVRRSGGGGGKLLLVLAAGAGFLFLSPRTGPQARRIAGDIFNALRSG